MLYCTCYQLIFFLSQLSQVMIQPYLRCNGAGSEIADVAAIAACVYKIHLNHNVSLI